MKVGPLLVILYLALIGIAIFDSVSITGWGADPFIAEGGSAGNESAMWNLFTNPSTWADNPFIIFITVTFLVAGAAIGAAILTKSDIALTTPLFVLILNSGLIPIYAIYRVVNREIKSFMCSEAFNGPTVLATCAQTSLNATMLITAIIIGPIAIAWLLACIEWWTQRGST